MHNRFPTRQVMHTLRVPDATFAAAGIGAGQGTLLRFVRGIDTVPRELTSQEISDLGDVFSQNILLSGGGPVTLREVISAIEGVPGGKFALRRTFLIAEGAYARTQGISNFSLNERLALTWHEIDGSASDIMVSASPALDDQGALLQLIAWSNADGSFHYFERRSGRWIWAGNSPLALKEPSRGQGPFDSHVNGSLVMKELKVPWNHWHSMANSVPLEVFPPDHPLVRESLFAELTGAEDLEGIVRFGISRWTDSRIAKGLSGGNELESFADYFRQIVWSTSVNLTSSKQSFLDPAEPQFRLPTSFFLDADAFEFLTDKLGEFAPLVPDASLSVEGPRYREAVAGWKLKLIEDFPDGAPEHLVGDTQFAFLVPERAHEDFAMLRKLVEVEAIAPRTALCILAVDFTNPLFSPRRAALLKYAPKTVMTGQRASDFDVNFVGNVRSALAEGLSGTSPEGEFVAWFDEPDIAGALRNRISAYFVQLQARLNDAQGVADILELAASRRLSFARRKLNEFSSSIATGENIRRLLAVNERAELFVKDSAEGELLL